MKTPRQKLRSMLLGRPATLLVRPTAGVAARGLGGRLVGGRRAAAVLLAAVRLAPVAAAAFGGLGGGFVGVAAVVGDVEPGAFEQQRRPGPDEPPQLVFLARRALLQRRVLHRLKLVEAVLAGVALVLIRRHGFL